MRSLRASTVTANAVSRAKTKAAVFKITNGGKYTPQVRALSRKLVKYGCSQEFVGAIIEDVCRAAGVYVNRRISRRTVARAIGEGGVAAKIQIVDEMSRFAISSDGTTHRNLEYMGRHVIVKAPTYTDDSASIPRVRLLLVDSELNSVEC
ncbi:hypothetical protein C8J57DRAFT_1072022 [Mycena rebaudengoi]|nr:hypothetical protein C8J57DRAFT_1072022 [Mycena rebaudengoi]